MTHDGDTDKVFPPFGESAVVERPIPIGPSIRQEFVNHRQHIDTELASIRLEIAGALRTLAPAEVSPASALRRVGRGAALGGKYSAIILAGLGLVQGLVKMFRPDLAGPFDSLLQVLGGS
jgi:hypothetical protein